MHISRIWQPAQHACLLLIASFVCSKILGFVNGCPIMGIHDLHPPFQELPLYGPCSIRAGTGEPNTRRLWFRAVRFWPLFRLISVKLFGLGPKVFFPPLEDIVELLHSHSDLYPTKSFYPDAAIFVNPNDPYWEGVSARFNLSRR